MKSFIKKIKSAGLLTLAILFSIAPLSPAHAQQAFAERNKLCVGSSAYGAETVPTIQGFECLVANILATAVTLVGIVAFVMFLVGGFQVLTAGANAKGMEQGRNSISFAVLGIVIALASFLILNVIAQLTGVTTILNFSTQLTPAAPAVVTPPGVPAF